MKLIKYLAIFAASAAVLSGCNDLEQPPTNQYTDANFWTPERAEYMVNTAYSQMYDAGKMWRDELLSDNLCQTRGQDDMFAIRKGQALKTTGIFRSEWQTLYSGIKTCHVFLDNVEGQDIEAGKKENLKAQVRFIRAWLYFRLTNFYGDVPFFTKDITLDEANVISRTPRAEVIAFIHKELEEIIPLLQTNADAVPGTITQGAAAALNARVYLYDGEWENVEAVCRDIMDGEYGTYKLFPSYHGLFQVENEYNEEIILERGYLENISTWAEDQQDMYVFSIGSRTPDVLPIQSLVDSYITLDGYTIAEDPNYDPENPYVNRDPRMDATVVYDGYEWDKHAAGWYYEEDYPLERVVFEGGFYQKLNPDAVATDSHSETSNGYCRTGYGVRKYFAPQGVRDWNSGKNMIMLRYGDVLLMYAEAMERQTKLDETVWNETIGALRARAGFTAAKALDFPGATADLKEIVRNERRSELALEGLRYFDIMRWKEGKKYLNGKVGGAAFTTWTDTYVFDESRDYLWAVPENERLLNENLGQNPNW